jgi:hypothetical protein
MYLYYEMKNSIASWHVEEATHMHASKASLGANTAQTIRWRRSSAQLTQADSSRNTRVEKYVYVPNDRVQCVHGVRLGHRKGACAEAEAPSVSVRALCRSRLIAMAARTAASSSHPKVSAASMQPAYQK